MRLNWAAVLVAAVVCWVFRAMWFTALKVPWQDGSHLSPQELQAPGLWPPVISLLCNVLIAYAIASVLAGSESRGLLRGVFVGVLIGMVAALAMMTEMVYEARMAPFVAIAAGYPLAGCILMGIILGAWKPKSKTQ